MSNQNTPFVLNGYSYADAKIEFNGVELPGVTSFEFTKNQTKVNNYGTGANPVSRSRGVKEYAGSMEMDYDTQNLLQGQSPTGLMTDIPPGLLVLSLAKEDGGREVVSLNFFEFNGDGISGTQGDENLTQSIDVIFGSYAKETF